VRPRRRRRRALAAACLCALAVAACGGGRPHEHGLPPASALVLMDGGPNSLDPALGDNPQALEADWLVYTPLLTYLHTDGVAGTRPIPALATTVPTVSDGGTLYTLTLRPGLRFSDGEPVRASDFTRALERAVRLWPPAGRLLTGHIVGASAFAAGRTRTIAGISTDDRTGEIRIRLTGPYGAFENLLALPVLAPVPAGTPLHGESRAPPPGVGLYTLADILPGRSFSLIVNPGWRSLGIPFLPPTAHVDVRVRITHAPAANAAAVLHDQADLLDPSSPIPPDLVAAIQRHASGRFRRRVANSTYLAFLNVTRRPFSSQLARLAVRAALDQNTLVGLAAGGLWKGCYVLPPGVYGHPQDGCPDGNPAGDGNLRLGRALVRRSHMAGVAVTVWTPDAPPEEDWMAYYASLLNRLGFRARLRRVSAGAYERALSRQRPRAQTGLVQDAPLIPYPSAFYEVLTGRDLGPPSEADAGGIDDSYIDRAVDVLGDVPAASVGAVVDFWHQLELHTARHAYVAVLGYATVAEFTSARVDFGGLVFNPAMGIDWSSLRFTSNISGRG